jgi:phage terminase large subunit-like protein
MCSASRAELATMTATASWTICRTFATVMSAAKPFTLEHFRRWAADVLLDTQEPWEVEGFQADFLEDVFVGTPECWFVIPEGNGKTTLTAGLALYHCQFTPSARVPWAASSRDQAEIGYDVAQALVFRSPALRPLFKCLEGYRRIRCDSMGSRIQVFAADDRTGDGIIPTLCILDELHRHRDLKLYRTWRGKLGKRGAQIVTISTAGEPGGDFEETRERIRKGATAVVEKKGDTLVRVCSPQLVLHEWAVPEKGDVEDLALVKRANPFSGITEESLREKRASETMILSHWRRFTCNLPTPSDQDMFVEDADWDALGGGDEVADGAKVCLGADGSRTWDTTVVAWASVAVDGRIDVGANVFSVREEAAHHTLHHGGKIDFDDVEAFVIDQFDRFSVYEVAYDPKYLDRSMEIVEMRLPESRITAVEPSSKHMRDALQEFYSVVAEGRLRHNDDEVLAAHLANTRAERGFSGEIRRVAKIDPRKPIDAVPALALAVWRASRLKAPGELKLAWV